MLTNSVMYSWAFSNPIKKKYLYYIEKKSVNPKITSNLHNIEPNGIKIHDEYHDNNKNKIRIYNYYSIK